VRLCITGHAQIATDCSDQGRPGGKQIKVLPWKCLQFEFAVCLDFPGSESLTVHLQVIFTTKYMNGTIEWFAVQVFIGVHDFKVGAKDRHEICQQRNIREDQLSSSAQQAQRLCELTVWKRVAGRLQGKLRGGRCRYKQTPWTGQPSFAQLAR